MQGLVDRIVDSIGGDSRVTKELSALQRIVNAAVIAMKCESCPLWTLPHPVRVCMQLLSPTRCTHILPGTPVPRVPGRAHRHGSVPCATTHRRVPHRTSHRWDTRTVVLAPGSPRVRPTVRCLARMLLLLSDRGLCRADVTHPSAY